MTPSPGEEPGHAPQPVGVGVHHVHTDRPVDVQVDEPRHRHQAVGGQHVGPRAGARRRLPWPMAAIRSPSTAIQPRGHSPPGVSTRAPVTSSPVHGSSPRRAGAQPGPPGWAGALDAVKVGADQRGVVLDGRAAVEVLAGQHERGMAPLSRSSATRAQRALTTAAPTTVVGADPVPGGEGDGGVAGRAAVVDDHVGQLVQPGPRWVAGRGGLGLLEVGQGDHPQAALPAAEGDLDRDGVDARVGGDQDDLAGSQVLALEDRRRPALGPLDPGQVEPGRGRQGRVEDQVDAGQPAGPRVGVKGQELGVPGPEQVQHPAGGHAVRDQPGRLLQRLALGGGDLAERVSCGVDVAVEHPRPPRGHRSR